MLKQKSSQQSQCLLISIFSNQPITASYFLNQPIHSTTYSLLIGSFNFQALSLVNTQKRTSGHARGNILFFLSLVNQKPFRFSFNQSPLNRTHRCQVNRSKQPYLTIPYPPSFPNPSALTRPRRPRQPSRNRITTGLPPGRHRAAASTTPYRKKIRKYLKNPFTTTC